MRVLALAISIAAALAGCGDDVTAGTSPDLSAASGAGDMAAPVEDAAVDLRVALPCGEPLMRCCDGQTPACNPATAVCNQYGVCVSCGLYPLACCPGDTCQANQTCQSDPSAGSFCYPCGHDGQPCCFSGTACVEPGTQCVVPDGGNPVCSH